MAGEVATRRGEARRDAQRPTWSLLTNHPVVLIFVTQHPESTVRSVAAGVGLTERATLAILRDLDSERLVERHRVGRRTTYVVRYERLVGMVGRGAGINAVVEAVARVLIAISPPDRAASHAQRAPSAADRGPRVGSWGFFTNHMLILMAISRTPTSTVREFGLATAITERAVMTILSQLEAEQIIVRYREGRRNRYTIDLDAFRSFRGWSYETWAMPPELIDVAARGVRAVGRR